MHCFFSVFRFQLKYIDSLLVYYFIYVLLRVRVKLPIKRSVVNCYCLFDKNEYLCIEEDERFLYGNLKLVLIIWYL